MAMAANVNPRDSREIAKFVDMLIERCATIAEQQAQVYAGDGKEGAGCYSAANAIRVFGKNDNI